MSVTCGDEGCSLEFFSASHGKWIPVDVIDMDASGAVQVSAKPGAWIPAKDCKRKLRTRVYVDDPKIGSTITSADVILQRKAWSFMGERSSAPASGEAAVGGCSVVTNANDQDWAPPGNAARKPVPPSGEAAVGGCSVVSNAADQAFAAPRTSIPSGYVGSAKVYGVGFSESTAASYPRRLESEKAAMSKVSEPTPTGFPRRLGPEIAATSEVRDSVPAGYPSKLGPESVAPQAEAPVPERACPSVDAATHGSVQQQLPTRPPCYSCPHCGAEDLPSFESAVQHCAGNLPEALPRGPTITTRPSDSDFPPARAPTITTLPSDSNYPPAPAPPRVATANCHQEHTPPAREAPPMVEGVWSVPAASLKKETEEQSALHADGCGETDSTRSSEGQRNEGQRNAPGMLLGEAIAYNSRGEPIITRTMIGDTGSAVTTVLNDDGSQSTFGKNTLSSLMSSDESDAQAWINALSTLEVRGLVHEIGQVLLSTSSIYQFHINRLKELSETKNYAYFGLSEDATDKEIDMAYRKLAKQMHPDKNGGTPEAKERFQQMKERYEALKQHRAEHGPGKPKEEKEKDDGADDSSSEKGDPDKDGDDGEEAKDRRKEAYDEDDEDTTKKEEPKGRISYDPTDQESLATTAVEMLQRLRAIEGSMATIKEQLRQHGEVVCM